MTVIANSFNYVKKTPSNFGKVEFQSCVTKEKLKIIIKEVSSKATVYNITISVNEGYVYWFTPIGSWDYDEDPNFDGFLFRFYDASDESVLLYEYELYIKPRRFVYELDISNDHFYYINYVNFFRNCVYDRHRLFGIKSVFDIGANIGIFSKYMNFMGATHVYGFEPDERCHDVYKKLNPSAQLFKFPISDITQELNFYRDLNTEVSRLDRNLSLQSNPIQCYSLEDCLKMTYSEEIDLLKLDIEGEEEFVILNTPEEILNKFKILIIEYHPPIFSNFKNFISKIVRTHPNLEIDSKNFVISARKTF